MIVEIPSDDEVVEVLGELKSPVTARALCLALVERNHPLRESQIAIQRAAERGRIFVNEDWTLSLIPEAIAA